MVLLVYLNGIEGGIIDRSFDADINPDPTKSSYLENYIRVTANGVSGRQYEAITYCFRWRLKFTYTQCLFWENDIGFTFTNPIKGFGLIMIKGLTFMFRLPDGVEVVPHVWNSICVVYKANYYYLATLRAKYKK